MTVLEAEAEVARIRSLADDDEAAHGAEDDFREKVLRAIAGGQASDPQVLALIALETSRIEFERWCG